MGVGRGRWLRGWIPLKARGWSYQVLLKTEPKTGGRVKDYMRPHSTSHPSITLHNQPLHYPLGKEGQWRNGTTGVLSMRRQVQEEEGRGQEAGNKINTHFHTGG